MNTLILKKEREMGGAYKNEKYKEGVYEAIKDVAKRPINKKVQFEGITLIIPENTVVLCQEKEEVKQSIFNFF